MKKNNVYAIMPVLSDDLLQLEQSISSVLNQSYKDFLFIIVDDGNSNATKEFLAKIKDTRVQILVNKKNMGISFSMNKALSVLEDGYVFIFHADDLYSPDRIQLQMKAYTSNPSLDVIGSWQYNFKGKLEKLPKKNWAVRSSAFFINPISNPSSSFKLESIKRNNIVYSPNEPAEDFLFWIDLMKDKSITFLNINKPLLKYSNNKKPLNIMTIEEIKIIHQPSLIGLTSLFELSNITVNEEELLNYFALLNTTLNPMYLDIDLAIRTLNKVKYQIKSQYGLIRSLIIVNRFKSKALIKYYKKSNNTLKYSYHVIIYFAAILANLIFD
jgi:glycosyltransferase involved in cell wall biosynthesis